MEVIGVNVAVFRAGRILLTEREDYEVWCLPGGHLDAYETFPQAARREVLEETGLEIALTRLVGIYSRPRWERYHIVVFAGEVVGGTVHPQAEEVLRIGFFDQEELPDALLLGHRQRILDAFNGCRGICRSENYDLPFGEAMKREDLYRLRDDSGLPRREFYRRHFSSLETGEGDLEIGPMTREEPLAMEGAHAILEPPTDIGSYEGE